MNWNISLTAPHFTARVGPVNALVALTRNGNELFWKVGARATEEEWLDRGDGVAEMFLLVEIEAAKAAALEFAEKIRREGFAKAA